MIHRAGRPETGCAPVVATPIVGGDRPPGSDRKPTRSSLRRSLCVDAPPRLGFAPSLQMRVAAPCASLGPVGGSPRLGR
jgi:hypothetical protein